ncbi:hypothetical protein SAMN05216275_105261 [Streptosporangium canum]|uniref:Uncharacterized protein n=1 Tax=Streptosporangium canum TaxID=324952 RepID=A0A1I3LU64_9ACTN|nr:hypothetical protein [Streptosporangium canum]SFI88080.1 hypothetical protein SAMN05216275_105261 [Streptosporangium canum]
MSDLPKRNGWTVTEWAGDPSSYATQRLPNRARRDTALRHLMLVMAALAICAAGAADARRLTGTQAPPAHRPDQPPPADLGMIPLTIAELKRLFNI